MGPPGRTQPPCDGSIKRIAGWAGRHKTSLSLSVLMLSFVLLSLAIQSEPTRLDRVVAEFASQWRASGEESRFDVRFWKDVTVLGGGPMLTLLVLLSLGFLSLARHFRSALAILACLLAASLSLYLLKGVFHRTRPTEIEAIIALDRFSFPSGHSTMSAMVYPTLFTLVSRYVRGRRLKLYCVSCGLLLMVLIGMSRVFLSVHYVTDILAGWAVGLSWTIVSSAILSQLQQRGLVETAPVATAQ